MPPKPKFSRQRVVDTAFEIVRSEGWPALSARRIARRLSASVGPIYSFMQSMRAVEEALIEKTYDLLYSYMTTSRTGDKILDMGLGYVLFARDEKHLFKCFIDEKYSSLRLPHSDRLWERLTGPVTADERFKGLSTAEIEMHRKRMIVFIYGLAVSINTGFRGVQLNDDQLAALLKDTAEMLLAGSKVVLDSTGDDRRSASERLS